MGPTLRTIPQRWSLLKRFLNFAYSGPRRSYQCTTPGCKANAWRLVEQPDAPLERGDKTVHKPHCKATPEIDLKLQSREFMQDKLKENYWKLDKLMQLANQE
ncbi:hypothetical protein QAD02_009859 [Eretmocerus hayati]|uniref:Uncharacterized protein n=1 Tax=Eretmocerus hayati TaxID=131215 RepID=A0ACC2NAW1_9HYME|nr:hypothetical protein QAD02_009859 [Eretmocerus hayati]